MFADLPVVHFSVERMHEFCALLFVPCRVLRPVCDQGDAQQHQGARPTRFSSWTMVTSSSSVAGFYYGRHGLGGAQHLHWRMSTVVFGPLSLGQGRGGPAHRGRVGGGWPPVIRCRSDGVRTNAHSLKHTSKPPPPPTTTTTTNHQPPTTNHQPPTTIHQPPTTSHQPPATGHRPPTTNHQPPTNTTIHHQPPPTTTHHQPPPTTSPPISPTYTHTTTTTTRRQFCSR